MNTKVKWRFQAAASLFRSRGHFFVRENPASHRSTPSIERGGRFLRAYSCLYLSRGSCSMGLFNLVHEARAAGYVSSPRRLACPLILYWPPSTPTPHWR